jgi:hypothetical protein
MATDIDNFTKNFRALKNLPKANVVRISVLSSADRQRYLGTIDAKIDATVKREIYSTIYADDPVFYGILNAEESVGISMAPSWSDGNGGSPGTIGGVVRDLAASTNLGKRAGAAGDIMRAMTGINGSSTGSSTMSTFGGVKLNQFKVGCTWYLPEQYTFCMHSLRNISRMAYPVQVPDEMLSKALGATVNSVVAAVSGAEKAEAESNGEDASDQSLTGDALKSAGEYMLKGVQFANDLLGRNLTLDPIPVRCSIGHYIDIEPLVINGLEIKFSPDTFLHETGMHIPVTCSVDISMAFWMTPAPKLEFMKLVGQEMFGEGMSYKQMREYFEAFAAAQKEKADAHEYAKDSNHRFGSKTAYENNPNKFGDMDDSIANLRPLKK